MLTKLGTVLDESDMKYLIETSMLNALTTLILQGFYAKVGFKEYGEEHMDCHVPHVYMSMDV